MIIRDYRADLDRSDAVRIFCEVGWITSPDHERALDALIEGGRTMIAEVSGSAECLVTADPGTLRYLDHDLPLSAITGVTTSRIARKQGLAGRLTARLLGEEAQEGNLVAMLGVFEQGYYNRLGFGNGSYDCWCRFDPGQLKVAKKPRIPARLTPTDWEAMHASRLRRIRNHGSCSLLSPQLTYADILWSENGFGLGYYEEDGRLTHHIWCSTKETEYGPYSVQWMSYRTKDEFLELLGLLHSLEDQVRSIKMTEPPGIQLQDLLDKPFKVHQITEGSSFESRISASAVWQARILDLPGCVKETVLDAESVRFNLSLADPIERFLDEETPWRGIGGDYVVTFGQESRAEPGTARELPTLHASVNAFTRMWLGVRSASGLAWTDDLAGPTDLLTRLDRTLRLPVPHLDWMF